MTVLMFAKLQKMIRFMRSLELKFENVFLPVQFALTMLSAMGLFHVIHIQFLFSCSLHGSGTYSRAFSSMHQNLTRDQRSVLVKMASGGSTHVNYHSF